MSVAVMARGVSVTVGMAAGELRMAVLGVEIYVVLGNVEGNWGVGSLTSVSHAEDAANSKETINKLILAEREYCVFVNIIKFPPF